jgi:hypothetical protein
VVAGNQASEVDRHTRDSDDADYATRRIHHKAVERVFGRRSRAGARFGEDRHRAPLGDLVHQVTDDWQATIERAFGDEADWIG